jgi:hypothetical protein
VRRIRLVSGCLKLGSIVLMVALVFMLKIPPIYALDQVTVTSVEPAGIGSPFEQASNGAIITFGGRDWILVDSTERKLLLRNPTPETYFWGSDYQYNFFNSGRNSTYRNLNYAKDRDGSPTVYASLGTDAAWIVPHSFNVTSDTGATMSLYGASTITEKVGLLTLDEYNAYRVDPTLNIASTSGGMWYLLTPHQIDSNDVGVYYVSGSSTAQVQAAANLVSHHYNMRPVVYLKSGLFIGSGNGTSSTPYTLLEELATIQINPGSSTIGPVTVTATYPSNSSNWKYKIGASGTYNTYTAPFSITENKVIYLQYDNPSSLENYYTVTNIIVASPTIAVTPSGPSSSVTVTITYPGDPPVKQYSLNGGASWLPYTAPFTMTANGSVKARAQDAVGVYSEVATISVDNIDTTPPAPPTITLGTELPETSVTVQIAYPGDAVESLYHTGDGTFITYTGAFTMTANGTVYAKARDQAGNESTIATYSVTNIIVPSPAIAVTPSGPSSSVTVTITYPGDPPVKQYSLNDGASWLPYTAPFSMTANGSVKARAQDAAGVYSEVATISVDNIDTTPPAPPTITLGTELPATSVTVQIAYPVDAAESLYHTGDGTFIIYTGAFTMTANGTVYAKARDQAGNESTLAALTVSNIRQAAPLIVGVTNEAIYTVPVAPNSSDTGITTVLLRNGQAVANFALGTVLSINGRYELTVTNAEGTSTSVAFTIAIPAASALLDSLKIGNTADSMYILTKHAQDDHYTATVGTSVYTIYVAPISVDPAATITINGIPTASGSITSVSLPLAENILAIQVTSSYGAIVKTYTLVVSKSEALILNEAVTSHNGSSILLTFNQPIQSIANVSNITISGGRTITTAVYSSSTLVLSLNTAILPGEAVTITFPANTIYGINGLDSPPVSSKKIMNRVLGASEDGPISVRQIMSQLSSQQDADGDGIFDKADVVIWLQYIQPRVVD